MILMSQNCLNKTIGLVNLIELYKQIIFLNYIGK